MGRSHLPGSVTVVLFVRNLAHTVDRALESVIHGQPKVELIVLDGGSEDGTQDVIGRYEQHITFWRSAADGSATNALNEGIARAKGDVICLLSGDDWIEPGALHKVAAAFSSDPELDVLSCGARIVSQERNRALREVAVYRTEEDLAFTVPILVRQRLTHARLMRRRVYEDLGGYGTRYEVSNDLDFLLRVCLAKRRVKVLTDVVYTYLAHGNSATISGSRASVLRLARDNRAFAQRYLQRGNLAEEDRKALVELHGKASARLAFWELFEDSPLVAAESVRSAVRVNPWWLASVPKWIVESWWRRAAVGMGNGRSP